MLHIGKTLISQELLEKKFLCDLIKCKGACCIEGDAGAPLSFEETGVIENIFEIIKPFMRKEGIEAVELSGKFSIDEEGEYVTQLVKGKECAYMVWEKNGSTRCAFEIAFLAEKINFKKPISCHLYPVRIAKLHNMESVNFHSWDICKAACTFGEKNNSTVFQFLKEALVRRYGAEWFNQLEEADRILYKKS